MNMSNIKKYPLKLHGSDIMPGWYLTYEGKLYTPDGQLVYPERNGSSFVDFLVYEGTTVSVRRDILVISSVLGYPDGDVIHITHINGDLQDCSAGNLQVVRKSDIKEKYLKMYHVKTLEEIPESWKVYPQDQRFEVSNFGKVRLVDTKEPMKFYDNHGYLGFHYHQARFNVHRMVAECFVENPKPDEFTYVNHIDGVKSNNKFYNLEWVNLSMNREHAILTGLDTHYTEEQIRNVCQLLAKGKKHTEISILTGVSRKFISDISRGRRYKTLSAEYGVKRRIRRDELYNRDGMIELMRAGYKAKEIAGFLGIEYTQPYISYYEKLRREDLKDELKKT